MALVEQDSELWQLCKELEELGGGISTRLEPVSLLNLTRSDEWDPPYVKHSAEGKKSHLTI
jgi:hypothetical protein